MSCRPDFLSRCTEAGDMQQLTAEGLSHGLQQQPGCTNMELKKLKDGRLSFPSGHSSCSMAVGLFAALYMLWTLHWREGALHHALLRPASSILGRIGKDVASLAVLLVLLFQIAWPWGVALSRFMDNRHNVSDVVGGLLLAVCFVPVFVVRLASSASAAHQAENQDWSSQEQQLLPRAEQQHMQQVAIQPLREAMSFKDVMQQDPVSALQQPAPEQNEVQLTVNSVAALEFGGAPSAVVPVRQAITAVAGQAVPAVADGNRIL
eukprot:GHRQ01018471.1.p1 GENE.GHRQ01018471.1~~GHRQ01018471.1.p1  ORF type:complete len:263 (+),score=78.78 GHRQ01018471.1:583-1371(+)